MQNSGTDGCQETPAQSLLSGRLGQGAVQCCVLTPRHLPREPWQESVHTYPHPRVSRALSVLGANPFPMVSLLRITFARLSSHCCLAVSGTHTLCALPCLWRCPRVIYSPSHPTSHKAANTARRLSHTHTDTCKHPIQCAPGLLQTGSRAAPSVSTQPSPTSRSRVAFVGLPFNPSHPSGVASRPGCWPGRSDLRVGASPDS